MQILYRYTDITCRYYELSKQRELPKAFIVASESQFSAYMEGIQNRASTLCAGVLLDHQHISETIYSLQNLKFAELPHAFM